MQIRIKLEEPLPASIVRRMVCHYHTEEINYKGSNDVNGIVRSYFVPSKSEDVYDTIFCPDFEAPGGNAYFIGLIFLTNRKTTEQLLWYVI